MSKEADWSGTKGRTEEKRSTGGKGPNIPTIPPVRLFQQRRHLQNKVQIRRQRTDIFPQEKMDKVNFVVIFCALYIHFISGNNRIDLSLCFKITVFFSFSFKQMSVLLWNKHILEKVAVPQFGLQQVKSVAEYRDYNKESII